MKLLLGCYRKLDAHNPEIFTAGMIAILCEYPQQIVFRVTSPTGPLVGKGDKYVPALAEIRQALETEMKPFRDEEVKHQRRSDSDNILGFNVRKGTQAERTAFIDKFVRDNPHLLTEKFARERFGKKDLEPLDEDALRSRMSAPLTVSNALKAKIAAEITEVDF